MRWNPFKKATLQIYTPVNGKIIPLEEVPDPVFSEKLMGEGIAIIPTKGNIYAPVEGAIIQIAPTKHAIGILAKGGTEILIHVGLETVSLKGKGFNVLVNVGDKISSGQLLIETDWEYISTNAKSTVIPIVITNSHKGDKQYTITEEKEAIFGKTVIITASAK
ncbi:PTS glucose transporter subunit IIA [Neobacillus pocheonensis]|uniref:PTS glucose transporter subunit IIA n=1 Tax=Neobacillus pocheonensis TaxID=363869 RepID=A0ABT0WCA1_9BACI|nr:PTS glucose transporter subunit IIA [Neobacillus pocheonensis]